MLMKPARESVNEPEIAVHVLILDHRAPHDDLRDEDERNDIGRGFRVGDEGGNNQAQRDPAHCGHEDDREVRPEHPANLEEVIADEDKENALDEGKHA
jgi:hypothetical protein